MTFTVRVFVAGPIALAPDQNKGELSLVLQDALCHHYLPVVLYERKMSKTAPGRSSGARHRVAGYLPQDADLH